MSNSLGCCFITLPSRSSWTDSSNATDDDGHKADSLRNSPQGWKTTPYILGNEVTATIVNFGLTWSMIFYLTQNYHMSKVSAVYCWTITTGITSLTPMVGGFIADAYLGRYWTILFGSMSIFLGMVTLLFTATVPSLTPGAPCVGEGSGPKTCPPASKAQMGFLYLAFLFLAIGAGGLRPCSYPFGADQFGQTTVEQKKQLQSFFNLYYFALFIAMVLAATVIVYIELDVSWAIAFGLLAALIAIAIVIFLSGSSKYRYITPTGSPFTDVAKVIVAAYRKRNVALPNDPSELYHGEDHAKDQLMLAHTDQFWCLDKAAVMVETERGRRKEWKLSEVHNVEQVKCVARVIPIWASGIVAGSMIFTQHSFVPLQAQAMDRYIIRSSSFQVPASSIAVVAILASIVWLPFYDRAVVPLARKYSRDPVRGISFFQRIGTGYLLALISALIAAPVETYRRHSSPSSPISVFWLVPQLILFGISDALYIIGLIEFFYDKMPHSLRSVAGAMFSVTLGLGNFLGAIVLAIVQRVTGRSGHRKWIVDDLSHGHLDYYYYLLAVLLALNCVYFFACARNYKPSRSQQPADLTHLNNKPNVEPVPPIPIIPTKLEADRPTVPKDSTPQMNKMPVV